MDTKDAYLSDQHRQGFEKFYTKKQELTAYALACGYVQLHTSSNGTQVRLTDSMGDCWDVRVWPPGYYDPEHPDKSWEQYTSLTEAKAEYRKLVRRFT